MYILKHIPEDFRVREIRIISPQDLGRYHYYKLTKKNRNTLDVVKQLARILNIREKEIGFAGSKDKHAVTEQVISIVGVSREKVLQVIIYGVSLDFLGYGNNPVTLGDLAGNEFEIVVRNLDTKMSFQQFSYVENYFDEQRFSSQNVEIGRCLVKKEFGKAAVLIDDKKVKDYLQKQRNDAVGALKCLPIRLLRMYVHAFQSCLWNETVAQYLEQKGREIKKISYSQGEFVFVSNSIGFSEKSISLLGFEGNEVEDPEVQAILSAVMVKENIKHADFIIKQIPELTLEGEERKVVAKVNDFSCSPFENDDLNAGKKKMHINFSLPKGSYATMVVRRLFAYGK